MRATALLLAVAVLVATTFADPAHEPDELIDWLEHGNKPAIVPARGAGEAAVVTPSPSAAPYIDSVAFKSLLLLTYFTISSVVTAASAFALGKSFLTHMEIKRITRIAEAKDD